MLIGTLRPYIDTDLAAKFSSGSKASAAKSENIISTTDRLPARARPAPTPAMPPSLSGEDSTRSGKRSESPGSP